MPVKFVGVGEGIDDLQPFDARGIRAESIVCKEGETMTTSRRTGSTIELRPVEITTDFTKFAEGSVPHPLRRHDGAVLRLAWRSETPPHVRRGPRLGHGGVLHAAPGQPGAQPPGRGQAEARPAAAPRSSG